MDGDSSLFIAEVLTFVAINADSGILSDSIKTEDSFSVEKFPVNEVLQILTTNQATASCRVAAKMMVRILLDNGFNAYTYAFGFPNEELGHTVALVENGRKLSMYDPYLNYYPIDKDGRPLDFIELIANFENPQYEPALISILVNADLNVDFSLIDSAQIWMDASDECRS